MKRRRLKPVVFSMSLLLAFASCVPVPVEQLYAVRICHEASSEWEQDGSGAYELTLSVDSIAQDESLTEYGDCARLSSPDFVVHGVDERGYFHRYRVDIKADVTTPAFPFFERGDVVSVRGSGFGAPADAIHLSSDEHTLIVQSQGPSLRFLEGLDIQAGGAAGGRWFSDCRTIEEVSAIFSDGGESLELAPRTQGTLNGKSVINFSSGQFERSECFDDAPTGFIVSWAAWD